MHEQGFHIVFQHCQSVSVTPVIDFCVTACGLPFDINIDSEELDGLNTMNETFPLLLANAFVTLVPRSVMGDNIIGSKLVG